MGCLNWLSARVTRWRIWGSTQVWHGESTLWPQHIHSDAARTTENGNVIRAVGSDHVKAHIQTPTLARVVVRTCAVTHHPQERMMSSVWVCVVNSWSPLPRICVPASSTPYRGWRCMGLAQVTAEYLPNDKYKIVEVRLESYWWCHWSPVLTRLGWVTDGQVNYYIKEMKTPHRPDEAVLLDTNLSFSQATGACPAARPQHGGFISHVKLCYVEYVRLKPEQHLTSGVCLQLS